MKSKFLKEENNGWEYKIICPVPISPPNWIELSKEIDKLIQKAVYPVYPECGLAIRLFLDKHEKESIDWEIKILNSSDSPTMFDNPPRKQENHFLTFSSILEIEKKFSEIQKQERVKPEMYITFIPRKSEHSMR
jgi:hypothetical protein